MISTPASGAGQSNLTAEARHLVDLALGRSPLVQQATHRADQAFARLDETSGFFDPRLTGIGGVSQWARSIPGSSALFLLPDNAGVLQGAVDVPVLPGAYLSAGFAERYCRNPGQGLDPYYQSLLGVQLRIPLWRDFGFRQWRSERGQAELEAAAAEAAWRAVCQALRHQVELAYVVLREALASRWVTDQSLRRAERLLNEAEELVRQQAIPAYQAYPARMELDLKRQDVKEADRVCDAARRDLALLVGGCDDWVLSDNEDDLSKLASAEVELSVIEPGAALAARGSYVELALRIRAAAMLREKLRDDLRVDVSFNAGAIYQGENETSPWGDQQLVSQDHLGGEFTFVLKRAWGLRAERARVAQQAAVVGEWEARLLEERLQIERNRQVAYIGFVSARDELQILDRAVRSAQETLESEQDRFVIGEGRSRNVLDAQKDLTTVLHRRNRVAALLLKAGADYRYAGGYVGENAAWAAGKGQ